jgi:hypothetical protein
MSQVVINQAGPLPITMKLSWPSTETVLVAVSGSAWSQKPNSMMAVKLTIHSTTIGTLQLFANAAGTHLAFPTAFFAVNGEFGETSIVLTAVDGNTLTDQNDHFTVALIY